jgi:hypothetical protein
MYKRANVPIWERPKPYDQRQGWIRTDEGVLEPLWSCGPVLPTSLVDLLDTTDHEEEDDDDEEEEVEEDEFDLDVNVHLIVENTEIPVEIESQSKFSIILALLISMLTCQGHMWSFQDWSNGGTNLHILHVKDTYGHFKTGLIMMFDPQNMGLETIFVQLSVILAEIW